MLTVSRVSDVVDDSSKLHPGSISARIFVSMLRVIEHKVQAFVYVLINSQSEDYESIRDQRFDRVRVSQCISLLVLLKEEKVEKRNSL